MSHTVSVESSHPKFFPREALSTDLVTPVGHDAWRSVSPKPMKPVDADRLPDGYVDGLADGPYPGMFVQTCLN